MNNTVTCWVNEPTGYDCSTQLTSIPGTWISHCLELSMSVRGNSLEDSMYQMNFAIKEHQELLKNKRARAHGKN